MLYYLPYSLKFKTPAGTSRGRLLDKQSWFLYEKKDGCVCAIGECSIIQNLSIDDPVLIANTLGHMVSGRLSINEFIQNDELCAQLPSVVFGVEQFLKSKSTSSPFELSVSSFARGAVGIPINGLIWMGDRQTMLTRIKEKLNAGFRCIKLKIGAINFGDELELIRYIRDEYCASTIEIRVDANGAFQPDDALTKLQKLSEYDLHSIEQPIRQGQWEQMAELCAVTPIPIALDEELIGIHSRETKKDMLSIIEPQYIILKPSLVGGFAAADEWITVAEAQGIRWWATSALESNVGLNAIAHWTAEKNSELPQGLGTGQLYSNNINSPLIIRDANLWIDHDMKWDLSLFNSNLASS